MFSVKQSTVMITGVAEYSCIEAAFNPSVPYHAVDNNTATITKSAKKLANNHICAFTKGGYAASIQRDQLGNGCNCFINQQGKKMKEQKLII